MQLIEHLVPMKDHLVRDPITKDIMLPGGEPKPMTGKMGRYWKRRILDGSVKILKPKVISGYKRSLAKEEE